jgi:hypothetical protein
MQATPSVDSEARYAGSFGVVDDQRFFGLKILPEHRGVVLRQDFLENCIVQAGLAPEKLQELRVAQQLLEIDGHSVA